MLLSKLTNLLCLGIISVEAAENFATIKEALMKPVYVGIDLGIKFSCISDFDHKI